MPSIPHKAEFLRNGMLLIEAQSDDCAICKELLESDVVKIQACGHVFHKTCLLEWTESGTEQCTCPMCRRDLFRVESLVSEDSLRESFLAFFRSVREQQLRELRHGIMENLRRRDAQYHDHTFEPVSPRDNPDDYISTIIVAYSRHGNRGLNSWSLLRLYTVLEGLGMRSPRREVLQAELDERVAFNAQISVPAPVLQHPFTEVVRRRNWRAIR